MISIFHGNSIERDILSDGMSETFRHYVRMVCQVGDHWKKVILISVLRENCDSDNCDSFLCAIRLELF